MKNKIFDLIQRIKSQVGNRSCLLAVSGGKDSILMAYVMIKAVGSRCAIAHFNHKSRPSSDLDENFVKKFAERYKIPFYSDVLNQKCPKGESVEAFYRKKRYDFLNQLKRKLRADLLCVAHTANDIVETFLFKLFTGRSMKLPLQIETESGIYRPLYYWRSDEVLRALEWLGLQYVQDETNADLRFDRNFIRSLLNSLIDRFGKKSINNCLSVIHRFEMLRSDAQNLVNPIADFIVESSDQVKHLKKLADLTNNVFLDLLLERISYRIFGFNLGPTHMVRFKNLILGNSTQAQFPQGITIKKVKDKLEVIKN